MDIKRVKELVLRKLEENIVSEEELLRKQAEDVGGQAGAGGKLEQIRGEINEIYDLVVELVARYPQDTDIQLLMQKVSAVKQSLEG